MGIEIETNILKYKNESSPNIELFKVGQYPKTKWCLETDTVDTLARGEGKSKNAANLEAKTIGGWDERNIGLLTTQILVFFPALIEWVQEHACPECVRVVDARAIWPEPSALDLRSYGAFLNRHATQHSWDSLSIKEKRPDFCTNKSGSYMPQITVQLPLSEMHILFELPWIQNPLILGGAESIEKPYKNLRKFWANYKGELEATIKAKISNKNAQGFLILLYYMREMAFNLDERGKKRIKGGENGIKYALPFMPRFDLKSLYEKFSETEKQKIKAFLLLVETEHKFEEYKIKNYLSLDGQQEVDDKDTFKDYVHYIIGLRIGIPEFYKHSPSVYKMSPKINLTKIILEFRGLRRGLTDLKNPNEVAADILRFATNFFQQAS
jgi:hypothetical protein